jgi:phospholipase A1/A2
MTARLRNILVIFLACYGVLFILSEGTSFAQDSDGIEGAVNDDSDKSSTPGSIGELIDYNIANNAEGGFSAHKPNYILPVTWSDADDGRKKKEIKFQFSVKQRFIKFYGWAVYLGYTQRSFWQAYDIRQSRPFRENDFNPELFVRTKMWFGIRTDFGIEHESNGQRGLISRSWNRIYVTPYYENDDFILYLKTWYRLKENKKDSPTDSKGDDNPDIHKYFGYCELGFTLKFPKMKKLYISSVGRYNFRHNKGAIEITATLPGVINSMNLMVQYFDGYGESLIDYNFRQRKFGIGFSFTR